ncbi:MAG: transcription antitermination factor NusB [Bacteroidia bacterium]
MLSRRHIRLKVMQALYGYEISGNYPELGVLTKNLMKSINKLYSLYLYLLLLVEELGRFAEHYEEETRARAFQGSELQKKHLRFLQNPVVHKLIHSELFHKKLNTYDVVWVPDQDATRKLFVDLKNSTEYRDYISTNTPNKYQDHDLVTFIIKHFTTNSSLFTHLLEEEFYNWFDDEKVAVNMALKTVKGMAFDNEEDFLLPLTDNEEENFDYAKSLLKFTVRNNAELQKMVDDRISKWEPKQVAVVDIIILKMALAEFLYFPSIPTKVTINEYIELSKNYSTIQSKKFINGVLDSLLKILTVEEKINKTGRGLISN